MSTKAREFTPIPVLFIPEWWRETQTRQNRYVEIWLGEKLGPTF